MRIGEGLLNLLFPGRCVVCDGISDRPGKGLCKECQDKIIYIKEPFCMKMRQTAKERGKRVLRGLRKEKALLYTGNRTVRLWEYGGFDFPFQVRGKNGVCVFLRKGAV